MRLFYFLTFAPLTILSGCISQSIDMYPVEGPLAQQRPLPVIKATAEGVENNSGILRIALPTGEKCQGRWSSVAPQFATATSASLFSVYGSTLYGSSFTTGIMPGTNRGQAFAACDQGTSIEAEFVTGSGTANGYGVAKDSAGNIYKMLF